MMWGSYGMGGWFWGFGLLVVVGVVILAVVLIRMLSTRQASPPQAPPTMGGGTASPKQILDERYAKGALTTDEYKERLSALGLDS